MSHPHDTNRTARENQFSIRARGKTCILSPVPRQGHGRARRGGRLRDAEHELNIEIVENECRKEFTKTERLEYARRLAQIEAAKAKERQGTRTDLVADLPQSSDAAKTRDIVAGQLGTSATQLRREQFIADNAEMLDHADFAEWDEGRLLPFEPFEVRDQVVYQLFASQIL